MDDLQSNQSRKSERQKNRPCGQAPGNNPDYAKFLINQGIDSISFNSDAMVKGIENMILAESITKI